MSPQNLRPFSTRIVTVPNDRESCRAGQSFVKLAYKLRGGNNDPQHRCFPNVRKMYIIFWDEGCFQLQDMSACDNCIKKICFPIITLLGIIACLSMYLMGLISMIVVLPCDIVRYLVPSLICQGGELCAVVMILMV